MYSALDGGPDQLRWPCLPSRASCMGFRTHNEQRDQLLRQSPSGLQGPSHRSPNIPEGSQTECLGGVGGGSPGLEGSLAVVVVISRKDLG